MIHTSKFSEKVITLTPDKGEVITSYNPDTDDIREYSSTTIIYTRKDADISIYRTITEDEDREFNELKKKTLDSDMEKRKIDEAREQAVRQGEIWVDNSGSDILE